MQYPEVPNHWKGQCFGCSTLNSRGLRLRFYLSDQGCLTRCVVPDHLCGIDGIVHGGIVALLLDEIAQWTMLARLGRMGVTSELDVRYLRPVPTGIELTVEGRIGSHDDKRVLVRSGVRAADGTVLAEADSQWRLASPAAMSRLGKVDAAEMRQFLSHYPVAYRG